MFQQRGFSIFEVLIVISLLVVVTVIVAPSYRGFGVSNNLAVSVDVVTDSLGQAQELARSGESDSDWSIRVEPGRVTVFVGTDFATRDAALDKFIVLPRTVTITGPDGSGNFTISFTKFTGLPQSIGDITIINRISEFKVLSINVQGAVSY